MSIRHWLERRRLKKLARKVSSRLSDRWGDRSYYLAVEIKDVCQDIGCDWRATEAAVGMFAGEEETSRYLEYSGSRSSNGALRNKLYLKLFQIEGGTLEERWPALNPFHDVDGKVALALKAQVRDDRHRSSGDGTSASTAIVDVTGPFDQVPLSDRDRPGRLERSDP